MTLRKNESEQYTLSNLFEPKARLITLVSEGGMYKLVLKSRRKEAVQFQQWVTEVLLPAVRKGDVL